MYTIISKVDRVKGNYEDVFIYTLNASFSGISGSTENTKIKMFIPENLILYLGDIEDHVKEIIEEIVPGGKNVIFDFGTIEDLGVAVRLGFGLAFNPNIAISGDTFNLITGIYIDEVLEVEYKAEEILLEVIPRYEIARQVVLPAIEPAAGSEVYFKTTLENFGDLRKRS